MGYSITNKTSLAVKQAFDKIFKESKRRPKKLWVDRGTEFFGLKKDIHVYSTACMPGQPGIKTLLFNLKNLFHNSKYLFSFL